jgi:methyltransferase (TIGR00027 family)
MREGAPSVTAQRVAAYRLGFDRLPAPLGDPAADERLARDVAAEAAGDGFEPSEFMERYLSRRTAFFDRVVVGALDRGVRQVIIVGAGYDGRALRYARPGVRWFEVDHPDTQRDKRERLDRLGIAAGHITFVGADLRDGGLAGALLAAGCAPDVPAQILCEGLVVYLDPPVLRGLLDELRSIATAGTRLALSSRPAASEPRRRERFEAAVRAVGEPVRNALTADGAAAILERARWRQVEVSEQSLQAGFLVAEPTLSGPSQSAR